MRREGKNTKKKTFTTKIHSEKSLKSFREKSHKFFHQEATLKLEIKIKTKLEKVIFPTNLVFNRFEN